MHRTAPSRDYDRIEQAIRYLQANRTAQPSLNELAAHLGITGPYLQRVFRRWAGVSPKTFLQLLTVDFAKRLLGEAATVLEATYEVGLSSPSRLHDHFIALEAVTPGEYKRRGAGLRIGFGVHDSPFGNCLVAATARGVCRLDFLEGRAANESLHQLRCAWPAATIEPDRLRTAAWVGRIFSGKCPEEDGAPLRVVAMGTNFQVQVWRALLAIPEGAVTTYRTIAEKIGRPQASRAVGQAVGDNPIAYLIPCHRVLRQAGDLGGYRWGVERKQAMLAWEAARTNGS